MRYRIVSSLFLFALLLASCSSTHRIYIPDQPCLIPTTGFNFILCNDFYVQVDYKSFVVPMGFQTDLASIPRFLWSIDPPQKADTIAGAVLHDYLYSCHQEMDRLEIDNILYDALIFEHVGRFNALKYWLGVRLFGASHFNDKEQVPYANARAEHPVSCNEMAPAPTPRSTSTRNKN